MSDAAKDKDAAPKKGKKGLIIAIAAVLLLGGGGAGAFFVVKGGEHDEEAAAKKADDRKRAARVFVTLDPFVVNLADRDSERYAQVGVVLEVESKETETRLTAKMPAVRNDILLLISSKHAADLVTRQGKETLAGEIATAAARPLGWTPSDRLEEEEEEDSKSKRKDGKKKAKKPAPEPEPNPVAAVHFASFLVQ